MTTFQLKLNQKKFSCKLYANEIKNTEVNHLTVYKYTLLFAISSNLAIAYRSIKLRKYALFNQIKSKVTCLGRESVRRQLLKLIVFWLNFLLKIYSNSQ